MSEEIWKRNGNKKKEIIVISFAKKRAYPYDRPLKKSYNSISSSDSLILTGVRHLLIDVQPSVSVG